MKTSFATATTAAFILAAASLSAQTSGTSHPEALDDNITVAAPQPPAAKPSPAVPMEQASQPPAPILREREVPTYSAVQTSTSTPVRTSIIDSNDDNSGIVTDTSTANELPEGTLVRVRLNKAISTRDTARSDEFQALLSAPIEHHGRIVIPAGSILSGRVTDLYTGHHIGKAAGIHLQDDRTSR